MFGAVVRHVRSAYMQAPLSSIFIFTFNYCLDKPSWLTSQGISRLRTWARNSRFGLVASFHRKLARKEMLEGYGSDKDNASMRTEK